MSRNKQEKNLCEFGFFKQFLDMTPKARFIKKKNYNLDKLSELKYFALQKILLTYFKRQVISQKETDATHIHDNVLLCKCIKNSQNSTKISNEKCSF